MAEQYIFTIENLTKAYGKREVLKNIWLAFFPGAKIGVIGNNGAGKSSLLRVMALVEQDFLGNVRPANNITIGFVPQEPRLDETLHVAAHVEGLIQPWLLRDKADGDVVGGADVAQKILLDKCHDAQQTALARAVVADDADLGAGEEGEPDVLQNFTFAVGFREVFDGEDVLLG